METNAFLSGNTNAKQYTFTKVRPEDMSGNVDVIQSVFGKNTGITVENRKEWIKKNSDVSYQLCVDNVVVGCGTLLPLHPERIAQILRGEVNSEETSPDEIEPYETGKTYHIYAMGLCVSPVLSKQEKRWYGAKLVRGLFEAIIDLGRRGIEIETITARSMMFDGIRILRHMGFKQIPSITNNINYRITVDEADDIEVIQHYKKALYEAKDQQKARKATTE